MSDFDPITFRASDFVNAMFQGIGTPTLAATIEQGRLADVVDVNELEAYATVAAVAWSEAAPSRGPELAEYYGLSLFTVFMGDQSQRYTEVDGQPAVTRPDGPPIVVTEDVIRHWEWLFMIFSHEEVARALLGAVPDSIRERAEAQVDVAVDHAFERLVEQL